MNKRRVWALVLSIVMVLSVFAYVPVQNVEAAGVSVQYKSHVQTFGWESAWKRDGEASGTSGKAKRLEGIRITVSGDNLGVRYTTHCQTYGWLPWVSNGEMSGTQGEAKRLEAIKIELTGANAQNYDIYYRVHAQSYGWLAWAKNGQAAGTAGLAKRLEAIQIVVVARGTTVQNNVNGIVSRYGRNYVWLAGMEEQRSDGRYKRTCKTPGRYRDKTYQSTIYGKYCVSHTCTKLWLGVPLENEWRDVRNKRAGKTAGGNPDLPYWRTCQSL